MQSKVVAKWPNVFFTLLFLLSVAFLSYIFCLFFLFFVIYNYSLFRVNDHIVFRRLVFSFLLVLYCQHDWKIYGSRRGTFFVLIGRVIVLVDFLSIKLECNNIFIFCFVTHKFWNGSDGEQVVHQLFPS
jgi:hypothetical protein